MLRCSIPVRCASTVVTTGSTSTTTESLFRRVFASQTTMLDLIPVKKPLIEGSLSWLPMGHFELVIVSGVKGTSPDEVAESVKHRAVSFLSNCGGGDALKGSQMIRSSLSQSTKLRGFMDAMDLHVRLVFFQSSCSSKELRCAVYASDPWDPHQQERYLSDVVSSPSLQTIDQIIRAALLVARQEAQAKSRQLLRDTVKEARLVLSTAPSELVPSTLGEGPTLIPSPRYEVDIEFVHLREKKEKEKVSDTKLAASWVLRDDVDNTESCDLPLVALRDTHGLVHSSKHSGLHPIDAPQLTRHAADGAITRVRTVDGSESLHGVLQSLWRHPQLHTQLLRAAARVSPPRAEDFVGICGRAVVSAWLSALGRAGRVPPLLPLHSAAEGHGAFLRAGLRHELGSRAEVQADVGPLRFVFVAAPTPCGRVATAVGGFASTSAALSALLPWHIALPPAPLRVNGHGTEERHSANSPAASRATGSSTAGNGKDVEEPPSVMLRVIDMEETLRRMGVTAGDLNGDVLTYRDASGTQLFRFEEMNSLTGIERFVRRVRRCKEPCFITVRLTEGSRNFRVIWAKAFGEHTALKAPHYIKYVRVAVPLLPKHHFSLRFTSLYYRDFVTHGLLNMLHQHSEDPSQWPLRLQTPCFFNMWKMTRSSIHAIMMQDPEFRYTVELRTDMPRRVKQKKTNSDNTEDNARLVLRLFSGETMTSEIILKKNHELADAYQCFTEHAAKLGCNVPSMVDTIFPHVFISENFSTTYKGLVTSILNNSEVFVQKPDEVRLEVQITKNVHLVLAKGTNVATGREPLCEMFITQQFPSILPTLKLFTRVHKVLCSGKKQQFRCTNIADCYRWEFSEGEKVIKALSGKSRLDVLTELLGNIEDTLGDLPGSTVGSDDPLDSKGACTVNPVKKAQHTTRAAGATSPFFSEGNLAYYQDLLAKRYGMVKIIHEYDIYKRAFVIKGITQDQKPTVIRYLVLSSEMHIMDIVYRYYRWLLQASLPPKRQDDDALLKSSLTTIYSSCQPFFSTPLPSMEESLRLVQLQTMWLAELSLPGALFGLDGVLKRAFCSNSKQEARRNAVCALYRALHNAVPPAMQSLFEAAVADVPLAAAPKEPTRRSNGSTSMISDLEQIVVTHLRRHAGYDGVIEYSLSHLTGITGRFVPRSSKDGNESDFVELFHRSFQPNALVPLQVVEALVLCACKFMPEADLRVELLRGSSAWPSLFTDVERSERLFCTTCLRRYMGLWTFEANDVDDERVGTPGTLYLVERTRSVAASTVEASLGIVQTPLRPHATKFTKTLASYRSSGETKALLGMWGDVAQHFVPLQKSQKHENMDLVLLDSIAEMVRDFSQ